MVRGLEPARGVQKGSSHNKGPSFSQMEGSGSVSNEDSDIKVPGNVIFIVLKGDCWLIMLSYFNEDNDWVFTIIETNFQNKTKGWLVN